MQGKWRRGRGLFLPVPTQTNSTRSSLSSEGTKSADASLDMLHTRYCTKMTLKWHLYPNLFKNKKKALSKCNLVKVKRQPYQYATWSFCCIHHSTQWGSWSKSRPFMNYAYAVDNILRVTSLCSNSMHNNGRNTNVNLEFIYWWATKHSKLFVNLICKNLFGQIILVKNVWRQHTTKD